MKLERAKGTRDFGPREVMLRQKVINKLSNVFQVYGYSPIETPLLEKEEIMSAKCSAGEESDAMKELFLLTDQGNRKLGLRYELTFQLARYIGMNQQLKLPFKRYQIGRVFRDGPIKLGRYREFWQCDVDIVGCEGLIADAEVISVLKKGFEELDLDVFIEINNRVLLNDILNYFGIRESVQQSVLISLDKLKKVGVEGVQKELVSKGIEDDLVTKLLNLFSFGKSNSDILDFISAKIGETNGVIQLRQLFYLLEKFNVDVVFNPSLARGLAYYTGPIFEVFLTDSKISSSVAGGGRWDKMIGDFLGIEKQIPATGVSFGLEPITEELKLKNKSCKDSVTDVFIIPVGDLKDECIRIINFLRENGIKSDMDLNGKSISKNLDYADKYGIPFVIFVGENEISMDKLKLKAMFTGEDFLVSLNECIDIIKGDVI